MRSVNRYSAKRVFGTNTTNGRTNGYTMALVEVHGTSKSTPRNMSDIEGRIIEKNIVIVNNRALTITDKVKEVDNTDVPTLDGALR